MQLPPVGRLGDDTAAGGHNQGMPGGDLVEHGRFQRAKTAFPVAGKNLRNGATSHLFEAGVGIDEAVVQRFREVPAHAAFAAAHHPH